MTKTNVKAKPSTTHRHDTPNNKTHIIKFRVTETEKMELQFRSRKRLSVPGTTWTSCPATLPLTARTPKSC